MYGVLVFLRTIIALTNGPGWGVRQSEFQTSLLSFGDKLENWNSTCSEFTYDTFLKVNNKGADQTAQMRRLVCACVVHKSPKTGFLASRPIWSFGLSEGNMGNVWSSGLSKGNRENVIPWSFCLPVRAIWRINCILVFLRAILVSYGDCVFVRTIALVYGVLVFQRTMSFWGQYG